MIEKEVEVSLVDVLGLVASRLRSNSPEELDARVHPRRVVPLEARVQPRSVVVLPEVAGLRDDESHSPLSGINVDDLLKVRRVEPVVIRAARHLGGFESSRVLGDAEEEIGGELFFRVWKRERQKREK